MSPKVTPFLMFEGKAEEAMTFYVSLFDDARVVSVERWQAGEPGVEGAIKHATYELAGQQVMCSDSPPGQHDFTFTPSTSLFVTCDGEAEIGALSAKLSDGGQVLMPLDAYGFSRKFAWVADRFGVSWQLTLPFEAQPQ